MSYAAPLKDMGFLLREISGLEEIARLPGYEEATPELSDVILEEAGKLATEVLAPLNQSGDQVGSVFDLMFHHAGNCCIGISLNANEQ